jgi:glycosyltransferase involved in cell wall biosynthesis
MEQDFLISIFIPVFNGEKYLEETLLTIEKQTYKNIEILLVDDSSTDNSLNVIHKFVNKDSRFKMYQKTNGGMAATSWNFILSKITGDFIFYSSQDDLFSEDLIYEMVKKQKETNAETIIPDMEFYVSEKNNNKKIIGLNGKREVILSGKQAFIESLTWNIHGFILSSKKLFENEFYPEDAFDSDDFITRKILFKSNKVAFSEGIFFYRQDNPNAITKMPSKKSFYALNTAKRSYEFLEKNEFDQEIIILAQFNLYRKVIKYFALYYLFCFESYEDKKEIKSFLNAFKKETISTDSLLTRIRFTEEKLGAKWKILYLICKFPFFYKIAVGVEIIRSVGNINRLK